MKSTTLTLLDHQPIVGRRGDRLVTQARRLPPNFRPEEWCASGELRLGGSTIRATLQVASDPTFWLAVGDVELSGGQWHLDAVDLPECCLVRVRVEILSDALSEAGLATAAARLVLTVEVRGTNV